MLGDDLLFLLPGRCGPTSVQIWLIRRCDGNTTAKCELLLRAWVAMIMHVLWRPSKAVESATICCNVALKQNEVGAVVPFRLLPRQPILVARDAKTMLKGHQSFISFTRSCQLTHVLDVLDDGAIFMKCVHLDATLRWAPRSSKALVVLRHCFSAMCVIDCPKAPHDFTI